MSLDSDTVLERIEAILHASDVDELIVQAFAERYGSVEELDSALYGLAPVIVHPLVGLYQIVFNRVPDKLGLNFWVGQLTENAIVPSDVDTLRAITTEFAASDEWAAFVKGKSNTEIIKALYDQALGRPPEAEGLAYWVEELDKGRSPADLILGFAQSEEFIARATPHIEGFLRGQEPGDPTGTSLFAVEPTDRTVENPLPFEVVKDRIADILRFDASYHLVSTFKDRYATLDELDAALLDFAAVTITPVIGLYQAAFNRVPDGAGLNYWRGELGEAGIGLFDIATLKEIALRFVDIDEWQDKFGDKPDREVVKAVYKHALNRDGDDDGIDYWTNEIEAGRLSHADLLMHFVLSDEFINNAAPHFDTLLLSAARGELPAEGSLFDVAPYTIVDGVLTLTVDGPYALTAEEDGSAVLRLLTTNHILPEEALDGIQAIVVPEGVTLRVAADLLAAKSITLNGDASGAGAVDITGVKVSQAGSEAPIVLVTPDLSGVDIGEGGPAVTVNGGLRDWFIVQWAELDTAYGKISALPGGVEALFGNYEDSTPLPDDETVLGDAALAVNTAFVALAASYANYLEDGGAPLTDFIAKSGPTRAQLIHDNILGNGSDIAIGDRGFAPEIETGLRNLLPDWVEGRPVISGNIVDAFNEDHRQALAIDWEKGFDRPDYARSFDQRTIDAIGIRDDGGPHFGNGNTPDNYVIGRHEGAGVEVGLKVHYRSGADIPPTGASGEDDIVHFDVPTGAGDPASWGEPAKWSFDFSVLAGINGQDTTLDDFLFVFQIDIDPSENTEFVVLELGGANGNTPWLIQGTNNVFIPDEEKGTTDANDALISQNSLNVGFNHIRDLIKAAEGERYDFDEGQFDIILSAATRGEDSVELARTHIVVNVLDVAEVATVGVPDEAASALPGFG